MVDTGPLDTLTGANIMATAIRYDRPSIFRDAWARAKAAAAEAAESVRPFFGTALRAAWAAAKAVLAAFAPALAGPRRYEHRDGAYATLYRRVRAVEGQYHVTVLALQPDGTEHVAGAVLLYPKRYNGADAALAEALRVIGRDPDAQIEQSVQQPTARLRKRKPAAPVQLCLIEHIASLPPIEVPPMTSAAPPAAPV